MSPKPPSPLHRSLISSRPHLSSSFSQVHLSHPPLRKGHHSETNSATAGSSGSDNVGTTPAGQPNFCLLVSSGHRPAGQKMGEPEGPVFFSLAARASRLEAVEQKAKKKGNHSNRTEPLTKAKKSRARWRQGVCWAPFSFSKPPVFSFGRLVATKINTNRLMNTQRVSFFGADRPKREVGRGTDTPPYPVSGGVVPCRVVSRDLSPLPSTKERKKENEADLFQVVRPSPAHQALRRPRPPRRNSPSLKPPNLKPRLKPQAPSPRKPPSKPPKPRSQGLVAEQFRQPASPNAKNEKNE